MCVCVRLHALARVTGSDKPSLKHIYLCMQDFAIFHVPTDISETLVGALALKPCK